VSVKLRYARPKVRQAIFWQIDMERRKQDAKWGARQYHETDPGRILAILLEEVGEVATALLKQDEENLEDEVLQVAAVAVAWLEALKGFAPRVAIADHAKRVNTVRQMDEAYAGARAAAKAAIRSSSSRHPTTTER